MWLCLLASVSSSEIDSFTLAHGDDGGNAIISFMTEEDKKYIDKIYYETRIATAIALFSFFLNAICYIILFIKMFFL
jgi:hypothetical protein